MSNCKYEITDISHEKYPYLHRIRALRDIGVEVKAGDLGGFVESEDNLSTDDKDNAWIYDDAIAAGESVITNNAHLRKNAMVCGCAYISNGALVTDNARVEDDAHVSGACIAENARICSYAMILANPKLLTAPVIRGNANVYGKVYGEIHIKGDTVVLNSEQLCNETRDLITVDGNRRTVSRTTNEEDIARMHYERSSARAKPRARVSR